MHKLFDHYVLRTPLLPVEEYLNLTSNLEVTDEQFKELFEKNIIKESIYLASPSLYYELKKQLISNPDTPIDSKLKGSFLKYISRMCSRPTPFGLFSGCSLGKFNESDKIIRDNSLNSRSTRLDMNLMGILIRHIENIPEIKNDLRYFTNSSLYCIGNLIRFVEAINYKNGITHNIIEIENSPILNILIQIGKTGLQISGFSKEILKIDPEIEIEEAEQFIMELIDSQVLISELQPTVSGPENIDFLITTLERIDKKHLIVEEVKYIKSFIKKIDNNMVNDPSVYKDLVKFLNETGINLNEKYLVQSDINIGVIHNEINRKYKNVIYDAVRILNKISHLRHKLSNKSLNDFKNDFYARYETKEVPLAVVLDQELGIGYPTNRNSSERHFLLDDVIFGSNTDQPTAIPLDDFDNLLLKKVINSRKKYSPIEIKDSDFGQQMPGWSDLPDTFSSVGQKIYVDNREFLHMNFITGASAGNLFTRFAHGNSGIRDFAQSIVNKEDELAEDRILAEISHLPEDRLGNILMRPSLRKYEIPYLSRPTKDKERQIGLEDLTISLRNNRLILRSIKHGKEVTPRLTSAHNYTQSKLPFYRFLGDMQSYQIRNKMLFDWENLSFIIDFFPRVVYKNIILSTSKWKISSSNLLELEGYEEDKLLREIAKFREKFNLNSLVYFVEGDNKLLVNLKNITSIRTLISSLNKKDFFFLEEFLFNDRTPVNDLNGNKYVNEIVFSFYKN